MELQRDVDALVKKMGGYWTPSQMLAALMEEVGELADEILAMEGVKGEPSEEKLREEVGDVLFALACIANYYGIDLEDALMESIRKYSTRDLQP
ncbi:nucleotide pyrophosphohydrolase [Pyrococcus yayanosii]|uniref:Putative regulatory protein n=1 Tax=Pyrococcus yayanosii (strain CH1 / JCM 16557) TaxID=529709 RepID=F8AGG2_PYRYC|nr:nucleotide pyrophosphohydrolase [Pyrococcus yayanosii]AEH25162.1 putative regulatory protein [Pyrococcus yayanosii CH1]